MKIICIGRNYADHAKEMNTPVPSKPMFFMKPETSLLRSGNPFYYPDFSKEIHYECELVLRINKVGKSIEEQFAHRYYDEIGLGIDLTARDLQEECKKNGHPWEIAKAFENSAVICTDFMDKTNLDLTDLHFSMTQNGKTVQQGTTMDMIFHFDQLIAYVSRFMTLKCGDLIYTGTPAGVGPIAIGDSFEGFIGNEKMFETEVR